MNVKNMDKEIEWRKTGVVKGIKVRGILPVERNACYYGSGSDTYGYRIGKVADDGTWFEMFDDRDRFQGYAVLATRKNFSKAGLYFRGDNSGKPLYYRSCGYIHGEIMVSDKQGCGETYLDPSF